MHWLSTACIWPVNTLRILSSSSLIMSWSRYTYCSPGPIAARMISPLLSSIAAIATELLLACLLLQFFVNFGFFSGYFSQHVLWICPFLLQWSPILSYWGSPSLACFRHWAPSPLSWHLLLSMQFHPRWWGPSLPLTFLLQGDIVNASHPVVSQR